MMTLTFDAIAVEEAKLLSSVSSVAELEKNLAVLTALIEASGWTIDEYNLEVLKRIDQGW